MFTSLLLMSEAVHWHIRWRQGRMTGKWVWQLESVWKVPKKCIGYNVTNISSIGCCALRKSSWGLFPQMLKHGTIIQAKVTILCRAYQISVMSDYVLTVPRLFLRTILADTTFYRKHTFDRNFVDSKVFSSKLLVGSHSKNGFLWPVLLLWNSVLCFE